jgi:hypothetical protein
LEVLCNYQAGLVLSTDEVTVLSEWLKESDQHQKLFKDLRNWTRLFLGNISANPRESIQKRLIEMERTGN